MVSALLLIISLTSMVFAQQFARKRGLKPGRWVLLAALIGPFALLLLLAVNPPPNQKP